MAFVDIGGTGRCLDHLLITGPRHLAQVLREFVEHYNAHRPTGHSGSSRPQAALPRPPQRPSGRCDETGSAVSYTNMCRSHDVTGFSAPTGRPDHRLGG
jgi:hypothetical protein